MTMRRHLPALLCLLAIPVVLLGAVMLFAAIDPEMARGRADYVRTYRLIESVRHGVLMAGGAVAALLWLAACWLVVRAKGRSALWVVLAMAGPVGFAVLALLDDASGGPEDRYQRAMRALRWPWRVVYEAVRFVAVWVLGFALMVAFNELLIRYQSWTTNVPVAKIVEQQAAESGMRAFGEGLLLIYLVVLIYLCWPLAFNLVAGRFGRVRTGA